MRSRWRFVFIALFLCFLFYGISVYADYNTSSNYCKTEFNSTKWIQSYHNCTLNTTLGLFHLNKSVIPVYEDFTSWIESDIPNKLSQTVYRSTFLVLNRVDENVYLYDTKTGELDDFDYMFTLNISSVDSSTPLWRMIPFSVVESLDDYADNHGANKKQFGLMLCSYSSTTNYYLAVFEGYDRVSYINYSIPQNNLELDVAYYVRVVKNGLLLTLYVYTDSDYSIEHISYSGGLTLNLHGDWDLPYLMIPQSLGYPTSLNTNGYIEYLWWGETGGGFEEKGVIYTKELLANTTEKSLMIGINGTAQTDTRIRVYTSSDNSTWTLQIDNNGLGEIRQYAEILYNYSTLYTRLNLTSTDALLTPYVDELLYLHTYECVAVSETKPYVFIILFTIIGMLLGYAIDRT